MPSILLFLTGVLSGIIAGYCLAKRNRPRRNEEDSFQFLKERILELETNAKEFASNLNIEKEKFIKLNEAKIKAEESLKAQIIQKEFLDKAQANLKTQFQVLSGEMLGNSRDQLLKTTKESVADPFSKEIKELKQQMLAMQKDSSEKLGALAESTKNLRLKSIDVQGAAEQLTSALKSPNIKGRWGEINLRRILEYVGLINYCDFNEQVYINTDEGAFRPDCIINIPGEKKLIVDSKAPIESYLDSIKAKDEKAREECISNHLKKVRSHIDQLSRKDYATKLDSNTNTIDGVILYIPIEGALSMALERDPNLLEYALSKRIILTFPTSLIAILKGLSMTIQQNKINKNIEELQKSALELHSRLIAFGDKFSAIGKNLNSLNKSFNLAVGSYERRLIPLGRKFGELSGQKNLMNNINKVEESTRDLPNQPLGDEMNN